MLLDLLPQDLESATEQLSEYLERDICAENLVDIKQKVQDKYRYEGTYTILLLILLILLISRYCDSRRKVLLAHVHEGYDKDWWAYPHPHTSLKPAFEHY